MNNIRKIEFNHRLAVIKDIPSLMTLMDKSIKILLKPYLNSNQIEASFDIMGIDTQLIEDNTYFIIEYDNTIVGCGGWSRRATLFGGNHTKGRDAALLDPSRDAARIRAMYTHPDWTRHGIGKLIIKLCEEAARLEGFKSCELASTLSGEPLYRACSYKVVREFKSETNSGVLVPLLQMTKEL